MDSKDLQTLIKGYNSHEDEIFDKCTDLFILKVRNELERMYKNDEWGKMTQVSDLGIYISKRRLRFFAIFFVLHFGHKVIKFPIKSFFFTVSI